MALEDVLPVIDQGSGLTTNDVDSGTAPDAYGAPHVYQKAAAHQKVWVTVENYAAKLVLFTSAAGAEQEERLILPGAYEISMINYGGKIKNRTAGQNAVYELCWER